MIPPRRSIPFDHEALQPGPREIAGDWPAFAPDQPEAPRIPAITFWLIFLGGAAVGFIGAGALAWSVLA